MKKKIIPVLALSTLAIVGMTGCNTLNGGAVGDYFGVTFTNQADEESAPCTITALDDNNIVSGKAVKVKKGEALNVKITFTSDYADVTSLFNGIFVMPHVGLIDSFIKSMSNMDLIDPSNYTFTVNKENLNEWTLNIPKSVMTQSYDVVFDVPYVDLSILYYDRTESGDYYFAGPNLFTPLTVADDPVKGAANILADYNNIDDYEHYSHCSSSISIVSGFNTTLYPNYLMGYSFDESDLNNLEVYYTDDKNVLTLLDKKLYSVELSAIDAGTTGSKMRTGYATGSYKFKFHMDAKDMFVTDKLGVVSRRFNKIKVHLPATKDKTAVGNKNNVKTCNGVADLFQINNSKTALADVTNFEFNVNNFGWLDIGLKVKDKTKYLFPKEGEEITNENLPFKELAVTSKQNIFAVKYFEDFKAETKDTKEKAADKSINDIVDVFFGNPVLGYEGDVPGDATWYLDNHNWVRYPLYSLEKDPDRWCSVNQSVYFQLSNTGETITIHIDLVELMKHIEYANNPTVYQNSDGDPKIILTDEGCLNYISSFVMDIEPTAIEK